MKSANFKSASTITSLLVEDCKRLKYDISRNKLYAMALGALRSTNDIFLARKTILKQIDYERR